MRFQSVSSEEIFTYILRLNGTKKKKNNRSVRFLTQRTTLRTFEEQIQFLNTQIYNTHTA